MTAARRPVTPTAPRRELVEKWHPAPGARFFVAGDEVRVDGERGARFKLLGFRIEADRMVAELVGGKRGRAMLRTVHADRLRRKR